MHICTNSQFSARGVMSPSCIIPQDQISPSMPFTLLELSLVHIQYEWSKVHSGEMLAIQPPQCSDINLHD